MFSFSFYQTTPIIHPHSIVMCVCTVCTHRIYPPKCYHIRFCLIKYWACEMNIKFIRETKLNIIISIHQWFCHFRTVSFSFSFHFTPSHLSALLLCVLCCVYVCAEVPVYFQHLLQPTQITCPFFHSAAASITYQVFVFHAVRYVHFQSMIYLVYRLYNGGLPTPMERERKRKMWTLFYLDACWCWHKIQFNCKCLDESFESYRECESVGKSEFVHMKILQHSSPNWMSDVPFYRPFHGNEFRFDLFELKRKGF